MKENVKGVDLKRLVKRTSEANEIYVGSAETMKGQKWLISITPNGIVQADFTMCK